MSVETASQPRRGHPRAFTDQDGMDLVLRPDTVTGLRFTLEATYGGTRLIDFTELRPRTLALAFARALRELSQPGGPIGATSTLGQYQQGLYKFFSYLNEQAPSVRDISDLRATHIDEFEVWLESRGLRPIHRHMVLAKPIQCLRVLAADDTAGVHTNLQQRLGYTSARALGRSKPRDAYSPHIARQLREAARSEIALIRRRLQGSDEADFDQYTGSDAVESDLANLIQATITRDGTIGHRHRYVAGLYRRRYARGQLSTTLLQDFHRYHYLDHDDIVPFLVLIALETGLEIECCKALTIDCLQNARHGTVDIVYLKRRARGAEWKRLRVRDEGQWSPGGLLRNLIELTQAARRHCPSENIWVYHRTGQLVAGIKHPDETLAAWIKRYGITDDQGHPLKLTLSRLRKTYKALWYIKTQGEIQDFAIGHTAEVAARHYADIPALRPLHEQTITAGLQDALAGALRPILLTPDQEVKARKRPVAAQLPVPPGQVGPLLDGEQDVWLASCADFYHSPFGIPDSACPQPFWGCLECKNAVITARKLPALIAFLDFVVDQRAQLTESDWQTKFGRPWARISQQILPAFPSAVVEEARRQVGDQLLYLPPEVRVP